MKLLALTAACLALPGQGVALASEPPPVETGTSMGPQEFQRLASKKADVRIRYGQDLDQFADLRIPSGKRPHPVAILIHGGCWKAAYSTLSDLAPMADALKAEGIASWNVEYRRLGQVGGGWPGTYLDVAEAVDHLRAIAGKYNLDLSRVVVVGHSAGGHLAMWAAARHRLSPKSPLFKPQPLPMRAVFDLAGGPEMAAYIPVEQHGCAAPVAEEMMGGSVSEFAARYRDASAASLLPLNVRQIIVWGEKDDVIPIALGRNYVQKARKSGDDVEFLAITGAGHFEIASPFDKSWPRINARIIRALDPAIGR